jgi:RNA polymerase sigma-70 factor (TIGR02960 family)
MRGVTADLIDRARSGDDDAFRALVAPHEAELRLHCYRMLGSAQDAEDTLQEVLLAAWRGLAGFEGRASVRTWLYRVATTRCLNALRSRARRAPATPPPHLALPPPTRRAEVTWLEPYPDTLLAALPDNGPGPEARFESREAISLAFVTAVQVLPPRQRAVLLLRDVLGFSAAEAAAILAVTEDAVKSALKRARAALGDHPADAGQAPPTAGSPEEAALAERLTAAYTRGDVAAIIALFTDDAWLRMPPLPLEYQGREPIGRFLRTVAFRDGRTFRLTPARYNGQLAFEAVLPGATAPHDLLVLTLTTGPAGAGIAGMTRFWPPRPLGGPAGV